MPIREQCRTPVPFACTSRNEGRVTCNGKLVIDLFCAKRNRNTQPSRRRRRRPSPPLYPTLLLFCTNHLTSCFSRALGKG